VFTVASALLLACGSSSKATSTASESDLNAILKVGINFAAAIGPSLDPANYNSQGSGQGYADMMYDTMVRVTPEGVKPGLATEWKFPDAFTIELQIREGVKFQDGTPLTPTAVKASWDRVIATPTTVMTKIPAIASMKSVELFGTNGVRVTLSQPQAGTWRDRLLPQAVSGLGVVSPAQLAKLGDAQFRKLPLSGGAGPYQLVEYVPNEKIVLRKWDGYWDKENQKLGGVEFTQMLPGAPTIAAILGGVVDLVLPTANDADQLKAQGINVSSSTPPDQGEWLQFCLTKTPTDKLAVRQAVAHGLNRDDFVSSVYHGYAVPNYHFISPTSPFFANLPNPYPYDVAKAKSLLASAGVAPGTKMTFITGTDPTSLAYAATFQSQMKAIGLDLEIIQSPSAFTELRAKMPNFQRNQSGLAVVLVSYIVPTASGGVGNWCEGQDKAFLDAYNGIVDPTKDTAGQKAAYKVFEEAKWASLPFVNTVTLKELVGSSSKVQGIKLSPFGYYGMGSWGTITVKK
jgi:ABC-type transport system substrate-binding protein